MRCTFCHTDAPPGVSRCARCGRLLSDSGGPVLEPEIVPDHGDGPRQPIRGEGEFTRVFYTSFFTGQGAPAACMPSLVSLGLALLMILTHGLLAGIGFLAFSALGRVLIFFLIVRNFLAGRTVNPMVFSIANWAVCWLLTVRLAGN